MNHSIPPSMKSVACPVTNVRSVNVTQNFSKYHVSYNPSVCDYGCDTTAIVLKGRLKGRVFFILKGNHAKALIEAANGINGLEGMMTYFIDHINEAHPYSEHLMACGLEDDPFELSGTTLEVLGESTVNDIAEASRDVVLTMHGGIED